MRRKELTRRTRDEPLAQALDRLGRLVAPESSAAEPDMVARVMARIEASGRREAAAAKARGRWLAGSMAGLAAGLLLALALWRSMPGRPPCRRPATAEKTCAVQQRRFWPDGPAESFTAVDVAPDGAAYRSTWSTVTESVVLERDVPVRKLLYSEFERVELLDAQGNTASRLIVPTKAMLVATKERY